MRDECVETAISRLLLKRYKNKQNKKRKQNNNTPFVFRHQNVAFFRFWNVVPGDAYPISRQSLVLSQSRCVRGMRQVHKVKVQLLKIIHNPPPRGEEEAEQELLI